MFSEDFNKANIKMILQYPQKPQTFINNPQITLIQISPSYKSTTMRRQPNLPRRNIGRQSHPLPQSLHNPEISMDPSIDSLLPGPILHAGIPTDIFTMGLGVRHVLLAGVPTCGGHASTAVGVTVGEGVRP